MKRFLNRRFIKIIMMMIILIILFILFSFYYYETQLRKTINYPTIEFSDEFKTEISVTATEQDLLKGVIATDVEDGDLTANVIIEQMSNLIKGDRREIVYVVCDSNNNVTKVTKEIQYTDYKSPILKPLQEKPIIEQRKYSDILACFKAIDVIDGDISEKIKIDSIDTNSNSINSGIFPVKLSVTNSCGDTVHLESTVTLVGEGETQDE